MSDVVNFERGIGVHWHGHVNEDGEPLFFEEERPGFCPACSVAPRPTLTCVAVDHEAGTVSYVVRKP